MLHLVPTAQTEDTPKAAAQPYAEALARLASIRHALRMVDPFGGGPASDADHDRGDDHRIAAAWSDAMDSGESAAAAETASPRPMASSSV